MNFADIRFPDLVSRYDLALRACVADLLSQYDVVAVLVSGTIVRGVPDRNSDLDINLLHSGDFRERVQAFYNDVPCEVFVNPPSRIRGYFEESRQTRRPPMPHMFATGFVMYDPQGVAAELILEAERTLANPPPMNLDELVRAKYSAATAFEDAEDLVERDPDAARLLLGQAVFALLQCRIAAEPGWLPRSKDLLDALRRTDPGAADLAEKATSGELDERFDSARKLCEHVAGAAGFFAWKSPREKV